MPGLPYSIAYGPREGAERHVMLNVTLLKGEMFCDNLYGIVGDF